MDNLGEVKQPLEGRLVRLIKKPQVRHFQVQGIGTKVPLGNGLQTRTELYLGLCCSPEESYRPAKLSRAIFRGDQYHHVDIKPLKPPGQTGSECTDGKYLHQYHEKNSGFAPLPERVQAQVCSLHICVCIRSRWIKRFLVLLGPALGGIYGAVRHISSTVVRLHADWDFKACRKYRFIDFQGLTMLHNITQNKLFHFPPRQKNSCIYCHGNIPLLPWNHTIQFYGSLITSFCTCRSGDKVSKTSLNEPGSTTKACASGFDSYETDRIACWEYAVKLRLSS